MLIGGIRGFCRSTPLGVRGYGEHPGIAYEIRGWWRGIGAFTDVKVVSRVCRRCVAVTPGGDLLLQWRVLRA